MRKGLVFTTDILIGSTLVILILLIFAFYEFESILPEKRYEKLTYITEDTIDLLAYLKVRDVRDKPTIKQLIDDGVLTERDLDKSVLDLIASFWYTDNKTIAESISEEVLEGVTRDVCVNLTVDGNIIYSSCKTPGEEVAVATRIESGYEPGRPAFGYIARAFLTSIRGKRDSSYAYFGGFVGQGNITRYIALPLFDTILEAYMELNPGNSFNLSINSKNAGFYINGTAGGGYMRADKWVICNLTYNINYCANYFITGNNTLNFNFTGNNSFIGGGYFKVTYNTTQMAPEEEVGVKRYWFPGIHGLINLYSSFYVPGDLNNMHVHLHYRNDYITFLTIGNTEIHSDSSSDEQIVDITNAELIAKGLNYAEFSKNTIPLRMGTKSIIAGGEGNADVILITDVSGSMRYELNSSNVGNDITDCGDLSDPTNPIYDSTTSRMSLARCLAKKFVHIILNTTGNRVGLVSYRDQIDTSHSLSTDETSLNNQIGNYFADQGTCICCGINKAYEILEEQSDASKNKFVVIMTDGIPSHQCYNNINICNGSSITGYWFDSRGFTCCCNADPVTGFGCDPVWPCTSLLLCDNCYCCKAQCEMQNANYSSCRVHDDLDATVHSIGFGPVSQCSMGNWTLQAMVNCGGGSYYGSTNATELEEIYRTIAENIVDVSYKTQVIEELEGVKMNNILFPDSYIKLRYTYLNPLDYGEVSLTNESERLKEFSGDDVDKPYKEGWFNVSKKVRVVDAKITSYSSDYWTDRLNVSNSAGVWNKVYWLGDYGSNYQDLGDPYIVQIPADLISSGNNSVRIGTGLDTDPANATGGSPDNRVIYTIRLKGSVDYGNVFNSSELAKDDAAERLLNLIEDYVDIEKNNIVTQNKTISGIQWLWGPSLLKIIVWE